jgi:hypothetical protein
VLFLKKRLSSTHPASQKRRAQITGPLALETFADFFVDYQQISTGPTGCSAKRLAKCAAGR